MRQAKAKDSVEVPRAGFRRVFEAGDGNLATRMSEADNEEEEEEAMFEER